MEVYREENVCEEVILNDVEPVSGELSTGATVNTGGSCLNSLKDLVKLYNSIVPLPPGLHVVPHNPTE